MHHHSCSFYIYQVKRVSKSTFRIYMQPCAKLEDNYTLNEKAGLYLAANGEYVFRKVVQ